MIDDRRLRPMECFDALPPALRRELREAPIMLDNRQILALYRQRGERATLRAIRYFIAEHLARSTPP